MKSEIIQLDPSKDERWDRFVNRHEAGSIYHTSLWKDLVEKTYGYEPFYLALEGLHHELRAIMPFFFVKSFLIGRRLVCLPFADYCEPLLSDDADLTALMEGALKYFQSLKAKYLEIKGREGFDQINGMLPCKKVFSVNHVIEMKKTLPEIRSNFHKSCIERSIRKAEKNGLRLVYGTSLNDLKKFYDLHVLTRRDRGLPPQPYKFFKNMWEVFYPKGMFYLTFAFDKNKPVAGIIAAKFKETMYFLYAGSDKKYLDQRPNHFLLWNSIKTAHTLKIQRYDLGRTSVDNIGLLTFKTRWGAQQSNIISFYNNEPSGPERGLNQKSKKFFTKSFLNINKKLPLPIIKFVGRVIYKHWG